MPKLHLTNLNKCPILFKIGWAICLILSTGIHAETQPLVISGENSLTELIAAINRNLLNRTPLAPNNEAFAQADWFQQVQVRTCTEVSLAKLIMSKAKTALENASEANRLVAQQAFDVAEAKHLAIQNFSGKLGSLGGLVQAQNALLRTRRMSEYDYPLFSSATIQAAFENAKSSSERATANLRSALDSAKRNNERAKSAENRAIHAFNNAKTEARLATSRFEEAVRENRYSTPEEKVAFVALRLAQRDAAVAALTAASTALAAASLALENIKIASARNIEDARAAQSSAKEALRATQGPAGFNSRCAEGIRRSRANFENSFQDIRPGEEAQRRREQLESRASFGFDTNLPFAPVLKLTELSFLPVSYLGDISAGQTASWHVSRTSGFRRTLAVRSNDRAEAKIAFDAATVEAARLKAEGRFGSAQAAQLLEAERILKQAENRVLYYQGVLKQLAEDERYIALEAALTSAPFTVIPTNSVSKNSNGTYAITPVFAIVNLYAATVGIAWATTNKAFESIPSFTSEQAAMIRQGIQFAHLATERSVRVALQLYEVAARETAQEIINADRFYNLPNGNKIRIVRNHPVDFFHDIPIPFSEE